MFLDKLPSLLAFLVSLLSIVAGGMVLRGWRPGYTILSWLPVYNFVMGLLTLVPAVLLWVNHRYALAASMAIFGVHALALALILIAFRNAVAFQSLGAMAFRLGAWLVILALLWQQRGGR